MCVETHRKRGDELDYLMQIEIQEGEVKKILDELMAAQETIWRCYNKLRDLGVVVLKEKAASGN